MEEKQRKSNRSRSRSISPLTKRSSDKFDLKNAAKYANQRKKEGGNLVQTATLVNTLQDTLTQNRIADFAQISEASKKFREVDKTGREVVLMSAHLNTHPISKEMYEKEKSTDPNNTETYGDFKKKKKTKNDERN